MPWPGHGRTYDLTIYGIVKFFNLAMENNPNIIDSLFTPVNCVLHSTRVGNLVRENRRLFLAQRSLAQVQGLRLLPVAQAVDQDAAGQACRTGRRSTATT